MNYLLISIFCLLLSLVSCGQNTKTNFNNPPNNSQILDTMLNISNEEWKQKLTPEQYYVLREKGTERAFSGEFVFTKDKGTYKCAGCGSVLFTDNMKFESHCGWPSFDREVAGGKIKQVLDKSHGMIRTEIVCATCGGHLGHIFNDGTTETGMRYCVNSLSLQFEPAIDKSLAEDTEQIITLGGGCFWCIEAIFEDLKGVKKVESGYSGGVIANPTYREVCSGKTEHAEVVNITFDPQQISLEDILEVFFTLHDPTTLNRQGADVGTQYRSAIFYHSEAQKEIAEKVIATLNSEQAFESPIVTEVTKFSVFYKAEDYHQQYYDLNKEQPYCKAVIKPKVEKLHKVFKDKLKK